MKKLKKVDITPSLNIFNTYKNFSYNLSSALSEYYDNSTSSFFENGSKKDDRYLITLIDRRGDTKKLLIIDNAFGMNDEDFIRAIKIDNKQKQTQRNKFGVGLKVSAIWFSDVWSIQSLYNKNENKYFKFDLNKVLDSQNSIFDIEEVDSNFIGSELGLDFDRGTIITLYDPKELPINKPTVERLVKNISTMYSNDIENENVKFILAEIIQSPTGPIEFIDLYAKYFTEGERIKKQNILKCLQIQTQKVEWKTVNGKNIYKEVDFSVDVPGDNIYNITGIVGWIKNSGVGKGGFKRAWNGRALEDRLWVPEEILGKPNGYVAQRMFGELDFSEFQPTNSKDGFLISSDLEQLIIEALHKEVKSIKTQISKVSTEEAKQKKYFQMRHLEKSFNKTANEFYEKGKNPLNINVDIISSEKKQNVIKAIATDNNKTFSIETKLVDSFETDDLIKLVEANDEQYKYKFEINRIHSLILNSSEGNIDNINKLLIAICFSEVIARIKFYEENVFDDLSHIKRINKTLSEEE